MVKKNDMYLNTTDELDAKKCLKYIDTVMNISLCTQHIRCLLAFHIRRMDTQGFVR